MDLSPILKLAMSNPFSDIDRMVNIYHLLSQVLIFDVPGSIVELGCNEGKTSLFLRLIIDHFAPHRELHVYDSFQGLPPSGSFDDSVEQGDFKASKEQLEENFIQWELKLPFIHEGWFEETLPHLLPNPIAFAYLDTDLYDSILISLEYLYPRLSKDAVVVIDDYADLERNSHARDNLRGVKKACDDFFLKRVEKVYVLIGSSDLTMGYIRKQ